jgi:hypothetical protein
MLADTDLPQNGRSGVKKIYFGAEDLIYFAVQIEQLRERASTVARLLCLIRFRPSTYLCDSHPACLSSIFACSFMLPFLAFAPPLTPQAKPTTFMAFFSIPAVMNLRKGFRTPKPDSCLALRKAQR